MAPCCFEYGVVFSGSYELSRKEYALASLFANQ